MTCADKTISSSRPIWVVLLSGCLVLCLAFGVRSSYGLFVKPITDELNWGREVLAFSLAIQNLLWGAAQPFAGMIADRYGAGRVLALSVLVYAGGIILGVMDYSPIASHMGPGFFVGIGLSGTTFGVVLAVIGRSVTEDKRSLALGIATASASLGQFLIIPLGSSLLQSFGWQDALLILAGLLMLIVPASYFLRGVSSTSNNSVEPDAVMLPEGSMSEALKEAAGHRGYWLLIAGFFVCGFHLAFITVHFPSYAIDKGLAPEVGAWTLALVGLANIFGSYTAGALGGTYRKKYLLSGIYIARSVAILAFILIPASTVSFLVFGFAMGLLWLSTVPLTSGLVAQIFGPKYMGTLFGFVFFSHQVGSFIGVWLGGVLYDSTQSYDLVWWISIFLGVFAAIVHWPITDEPLRRLPQAT
ncbi:MFS transporter [Kiloniella spongiae]|uniref:MFS transporter n=1 Tax=Kiloniella spongiae TaxID=1489064 RepID=A0A0H2MVL3_9PROT|nr:MFS transporter [Kiloniella spongiae]KLN60750.1 MFS transporter [Kiloniella spongiae]